MLFCLKTAGVWAIQIVDGKCRLTKRNREEVLFFATVPSLVGSNRTVFPLELVQRHIRMCRVRYTALDGSEAETLRIPVGPMAADADEPGKVGSLRPCSFSHQPGSPREISPRGAIYNIPVSDNRLTLYAK